MAFPQKERSHWLCKNCLQAILPFQALDNKKFGKLFNESDEINTNLATQNVQKVPSKYIRKSNICSVCDKICKSPTSAISCSHCESLVHAKCTLLSRHQLLTRGAPLNWRCLSCMSNIFPFSRLEDHELKTLSFNSLYSYTVCHSLFITVCYIVPVCAMFYSPRKRYITKLQGSSTCRGS